MNDLISRRAAIDALRKMQTYKLFSGDDMLLIDQAGAQTELMLLPPIQPEIVRCKDCKHWREGTAFSYCDKLYGMGILDALDYMVAEDDYCSMAERRTDEQSN